MFVVYVLKSAAGNRFYVGVTKDLARRLAEHNGGKNQSTKSHKPWRVVFTETFNTLSEARRKEALIKSWKNPEYIKKTLGILD